MIAARHLILQEMILRPSGEWVPSGMWTVVRAAEGAGYCLQTGSARELNTGDMVVVGPNASAVFRASQLGVFKLEYFQVLPQCLNGLITVTEWRQLEDASSELTARLQHFAASDATAQKFTRLAGQSQRDGLATRSALLQLWAASVTSWLPAAGTVAVASNLRERFRQFVGKMSEAELAVRPLSELAEELHCSERHFSRLFREEFRVSLRSRQTELRLQRARQLLAESDAKIINVAYESGYRHLGLFNAMFKRRFGLTPSQWRNQSHPAGPGGPKRSGLLSLLLLWLLPIFFSLNMFAESTNTPAGQPAPTNAAPMRAGTNGVSASAASGNTTTPRFRVDKYLVEGNTLLQPAQIDQILTNEPGAFGTNVSFDEIRKALADLQMAYRERGYVTVSVGLPQQRLTNAVVKIKVTEGRLADIHIEGNRFFSTPNVMRALPSLHTNMLLNSHVFQRELDQANASRDRQLYPTIGPGPEPGTTELTLKVKDRLPLHARAEFNDVSTPGTPFTRAAFNTEFDNLWDWEHQLGLSYNFSPIDFHGKEDFYWWPLDLPLVANESVFYRLPLAPATSAQQQIDQSNGHFGYNEVTHQFDMPPPTGRPELTLYASRSVTDTGLQANNFSNVVKTPLVTILSFDTGQNITLNEDIGAKLTWPMPQFGRLSSTFALGGDLKHFQQVSYNTNNFVTTELFTNSDGTVEPITASLPTAQPAFRTEVYYLPVNVGVSGSVPDPLGTTYFNVQANFNLITFNGYADRTVPKIRPATNSVTGTNMAMAMASSGTNSTSSGTNKVPSALQRGGLSVVGSNPHLHDGYITIQGSVDRVQRIYKDWTVKLHADGQWANSPLFSNEQYGMGGMSGVRGYQDGFAYGDMGWRVSIEPQTPLVQIGLADDDTPIWMRASVFMDFGQAILLDHSAFTQVAYSGGPVIGKIPGNASVLDLWGAGWTITMNIGNHIDGRLAMGFPLANPGVLKGWSPLNDMRIYFAIGGQF